MSSKRRRDYKAILQELLEALEDKDMDCALKVVVGDFEAAVWQAFSAGIIIYYKYNINFRIDLYNIYRKNLYIQYYTIQYNIFIVFPDVTTKGCSFHWCQAVWRKTQALGLQTAYNTDVATNSYIRRLLALPYIPHQHISTCFQELKGRANSPQLQTLCEYIQSTWIDSTVWSPFTWYVYINVITNIKMLCASSVNRPTVYFISRPVNSVILFLGLSSIKQSEPTTMWRVGTDASTARLVDPN